MEVVQTQSRRDAKHPPESASIATGESSLLSDSSISTTAINRSDSQREISRSAGADATLPTPSAYEPASTQSVDARLQQMQQQQRELQENLAHQETLIRGTESNIASTQAEARTGGMTGLFMWSSGTKAAMNKDIASMQELNSARKEQAAEMNSALERQQKAMEQFARLEQQGRELQAKGDLAGAQNAFNSAQTIFNATQGITQPGLVISTDTYREQQKLVSKELNASIKHLDTTESVLRTSQKVLVISGATIATGGAALAVGGVAGAAAGIAVGTAYGTAAGGAAALTEATGHIALGNKTTSQALSDAGNQTLESARDSAIASAGTVVGMGVGGQVAGGVGARLGTSTGAKVVTAVANGAAAGGTSAAVSTSINTGIEFSAATREFNRKADSDNLSPADRKIAYAQFMEERGLSASGIATRLAHDVSIGALGGGIGGATGAGRQLTTSGRTALAMEGGQAVADIGIGLSDAALRGQLNAEGITSSIAGAVVGNVSGRMSQRNSSSTQSQQTDDSSPRPPTNSNSASPEIYRIEDYRQQQSDVGAQKQELRLAAGAESMSANDGGAYPGSGQANQDRSATIKIAEGTSGDMRVETGSADLPTHGNANSSEPAAVTPDSKKAVAATSLEIDADTKIARERFNQDPVTPVHTTRPVPITDPHEAALKIAEITGGPVPPVGKPFLISPEFVRFTQNSIDHRSRNGEYTVIETSDALAAKGNAQLKPNRLPAIMLFVDTEGRIWSHDNRRLASAILADSKVNAQIMSANRVESEAFRHFSTQTDGRSVEVFHSETRERLGQIVNNKLVQAERE